MKMGSIIGWSTFVLAMLPAWAVKSATEQGRIGWLISVLMLGFGCLIVGLTAKTLAPQPPSPLNMRTARHGPMLATTFAMCTTVAILLSIAFTYAEPGKGVLGNLASLVSHFGSWLFPVVARYATDLQPPLSPERLFQVQSIVSIVLLASLPTIGTYVICWLRMSPAERRSLLENGVRERPSDLVVFAVVPFCLFVGASGYFGWSEFEPIADISRKSCIIKATCYAHGDDLLILAAAGTKLVAIVLFPLGALATVLANRASADRETES